MPFGGGHAGGHGGYGGPMGGGNDRQLYISNVSLPSSTPYSFKGH